MTNTPRDYLQTAIVCGASAAFIAWASATRHPGLNVPPAIGYVVAFLFAITAARLLQLRANPESAGDGFGFLFCATMATIGGWIAAGPGPRVCSGNVGGAIAIPSSGLGCRIPFGIGAVISGAVAVYCLAQSFRTRRFRTARVP